MHLATQPFTSGVQKRFKLITGMYTEILPEGGEIWGMDKRGGGAPGGSSVVSCEVLHSRGEGARMTQGGGKCPPPP